MGEGVEGVHEGGSVGVDHRHQGEGARASEADEFQLAGAPAAGAGILSAEGQAACQGSAQHGAVVEEVARVAQHPAASMASPCVPSNNPAPAATPQRTPQPALLCQAPPSAHTPMSAEPTQVESPSLSGSGGTRSRYGRKTAVTNFARLLDPMSRSNSPSSEAAKEIKSPLLHGPDDAQAGSMVEAVRALVYKVGVPSAVIAAAAVNPHSDKYIGVRNKQSGFGAVIKKNHSEINLGIYETPEEAARAYDMAALFCQGDRAKLNFSDSLDLYENHYSAELKLPATLARQMSDKEIFNMAFHGNAAHPRLAGGLLTDLADRLPYSAVRCGDSNVWGEFAAKNESLESWQAFGEQLVWLIKHQIIGEVLADDWCDEPMATWEAACVACGSGDAAAKLMQEAEQQGIDWNKVGGMWDAEGVSEGMMSPGLSRTRAAVSAVRHSNTPVRTPLGSLSAMNNPGLAGRDKRRRDACQDASLDPSLHCISDFARINVHIISSQPMDLCSDGLTATLDVIRAQKKAARVHAQAQAESQQAKREQFMQNLAREDPSTPTQPLRQAPYDRQDRPPQGRAPLPCAAEMTTKVAKGLTCRYCGKAFTHAPAHLQHERAHVQQQETMNPASRIYHHMPASLSSPRNSQALRLDPCLQDARARSSRSPGSISVDQSPQVPIKPRQVSKYVLELASRLPAEVSSLDNASEWEKWGVMTAAADTLQQVCDQMDWLAVRVDRRVMLSSWSEASKTIWKGECEGCDSAAELLDLVQRFERDALNWVAIDVLNQQPKLIGMKQVLALAESFTNGDKVQARATLMLGESLVDSAPAACVETGMPCAVCSSLNKGIAACFAQGHLFVLDKGGLPSSCKDCKQRNKGALFCFKRGHMHNLVPVLNSGSASKEESSDSGEDVVLR